MFDLLMKRQGQRLLIEAGWPGHLEWQWRLSHCQGDGCALYGWPATTCSPCFRHSRNVRGFLQVRYST